MAVCRDQSAALREADHALNKAARAADESDWAAMSLCNRRFHELLYRDCGGPELLSILGTLQDKVALIASKGWRSDPTWQTEADEHRQILVAAVAEDAELAEKLVTEHIRSSAQKLVRVHSDRE